VPSTILVFCHKHKSLDKRKELGKTIDKLAKTVTTKKLYENQLPEFVTEYLQTKKVSIDDRATMAICEFVGNDLSRLTNEIDKLLISVPTGESISIDRVMAQVGVSKEYNIFELQKAILNKDTLTAAKIVSYVESSTKRNPILPIVAFLYSFFSKLLIASYASDKSSGGLASVLKVSPYAVRDYSLALRNFSAAKIKENVSLLKEADLKLKGVNSNGVEDGQLLKELVYRLMH
jgi:DNA polymerase-3 subunit delta